MGSTEISKVEYEEIKSINDDLKCQVSALKKELEKTRSDLNSCRGKLAKQKDEMIRLNGEIAAYRYCIDQFAWRKC